MGKGCHPSSNFFTFFFLSSVRCPLTSVLRPPRPFRVIYLVMDVPHSAHIAYPHTKVGPISIAEGLRALIKSQAKTPLHLGSGEAIG